MKKFIIAGLLTVGLLLSAASFARADDQAAQTSGTSKSVQPVKQEPQKKDDDVSKAAKKVDLTKSITTLGYYGEVGAGCVVSTGHSHCSGRDNLTGMYSEFLLGTDIKLSNSAVINIQVGTQQFNRIH